LAARLTAGTPFIFFCTEIKKACEVINHLTGMPENNNNNSKMYVNNEIIVAPQQALVKNNRKGYFTVRTTLTHIFF
jgi:hypothetical protein